MARTGLILVFGGRKTGRFGEPVPLRSETPSCDKCHIGNSAKYGNTEGMTKYISLLLLLVIAWPTQAALVSLEASGEITVGGAASIPPGTQWKCEIVYDTDALDTAGTPTLGEYKNVPGQTPALRFFHYEAGSYQVTFASADAFASDSNIRIVPGLITPGGTNLQITIEGVFPPLPNGGGAFRFQIRVSGFRRDSLCDRPAPRASRPAAGRARVCHSTVGSH